MTLDDGWVRGFAWLPHWIDGKLVWFEPIEWKSVTNYLEVWTIYRTAR